MIQMDERKFEEDIEYAMTQNGWKSEKFQEIGYNAKLGLCPEKILNFIKKTQDDATASGDKNWHKFSMRYGHQAEEKFLSLFDKAVKEYGLLHVLRNGVKHRDIVLKVLYFKHNSSLNQDGNLKYQQNEFTLVRQFAYSPYHHNTLDIVLMINGIPLVAMELKNQYTGQNVENAKWQLVEDRDPNEKVFGFNQRFLVYFALDHTDVAMTTKLAKDKTFFLPFNQGSHGAGHVGGAGNPVNEVGYATAYLWEEVLTSDSLMDILQHFMNVQGEMLIFPRYHQLDVVRKLVADTTKNGSGHNYLIQHSAGSGKSNSIAWLAYQLSTLMLPNNEPLYHSVIVVTDRTVLDRQLQKTITSFDHTPGFVETIDDTKRSRDLKQAINDERKIIITTLQKFPVIYDEVDDMSGRRFAVIVDEAHSSQTGSSAQKLKIALGDSTEAKEAFESYEGKMIDEEDFLNQQLMHQGKHDNLSFFAFTATPKKKTLELFGYKNAEGEYVPFHVYSMRQAIEEGFILDVLRNYMTFEESWNISKSIKDNPKVEESQAKKALAQFKANHEHVIATKSQIIVNQIQNHTIHKINGRGKAMLVTNSRKQAVLYMKKITQLVEEKGYTWKPLVAFSGEVNDGDETYTEVSMNRTIDDQPIQENQLKDVFHQLPYRLLIVAEKYQTGFDEPLLHTMFVDKKIKGVKAVQTLSRLNRTTQGKEDTFVLDFINQPEDIAEAFQPYYEQTKLGNGVDIMMLYDLRDTLQHSKVYTSDDIDKVLNVLFKNQDEQDERLLGQLTSIYQNVMHRYETLLVDEDEQATFRKNARNFVKWYNYISQINRTFDRKLLKEKIFIEQLIHFFPTHLMEKVNVEDKVTLEYYRIRQCPSVDIQLMNEEGIVYNPTSIEGIARGITNEKTPLEEIIEKINDKFPNDFTVEDKVDVTTINNYFTDENSGKFMKIAEENTRQMFEQTFKDEFSNYITDLYINGKLLSDKLMTNSDFISIVSQSIAESIWEKARG